MGTDLAINFLAIFICLLTSTFFSTSETAITAVSRARIYHLILEGNRRAQIVGNLRKNKERFIGGIMLGNNASNILASALATDVAIRHWGNTGVLYATGAMTVIVVIFCEVLPKTYAIQNSEMVALKLGPAIAVAMKILQPLNAALQLIIRNILRLVGADASASNAVFNASDVIRGTIELHHHEGNVVKQDRDMLGGVLDMQELEVGEIMAHRLNMETIDIDLPAGEIINLAIASTHSRIPFWQNEPDNIIGVLYIKTLIKHLRESNNHLDNAAIQKILIKPWFIPETTPLKNQLHAFRSQHQHMALVVDEYGALQGLVTLEDIIEEIVGRINGEHGKKAGHQLASDGKDSYFLPGSMTIRDVNRELGWKLPDEEASTIAGLVIHEAQLIPDIGQQFEFHNTQFTILDRQGNQITRLKAHKLSTPEPGEAEAH